MPDIRQVTDSFAVAPQLAPEDLATAADLGFRTLINNRPDGEAPGQPTAASMREAAERAGLVYAEIPVRGGPSPLQVREMAQTIASSPGPVLAFCRSGTRSIVTWALGQEQALGREALVALGAKAGYDLDPVLP